MYIAFMEKQTLSQISCISIAFQLFLYNHIKFHTTKGVIIIGIQ